MSLFKTILIKIERIGQWGTDNLEDFSEIKRVRLTNYSLLIGIISVMIFSMFFVIAGFRQLWPVMLVNDLFVLVYIIGLFVNKNGYNLAAKILLHSGIFIPLFIVAVMLSGDKPGLHYYFLLYAMVSVLFWSFKDIKNILFFIVINVGTFLYVEFFALSDNFPVVFPENSIMFFRVISISLSFLTAALVVLIYKLQVENNEKLLKEQSKNLKINNVLLLQKNEEILVQNEQIEKQKNELHNVNITKNKFFTIIAHDLKSPFNALLGFSELLLSGNKLDADKRKEIIQVIYDTADQTLNLLNNLLIWSKVETGQVHFKPRNVNINHIIEETVSLLRKVALRKSIEIKCELEKDLIVYADKDMIATVIRNLISNAIKFSFKNSSIMTSLKRIDDSAVQISITDKGVGIDKLKLERIFENENNYTEKGTEGEKGTGLGLKLCQEFVQENNGKLWVESKKGEGSVFSFTVPVNLI